MIRSTKSKGLKPNLSITQVLVSGDITKVGMSESKVELCAVCSLRVRANSVLCVHCAMWIHGRCVRVKMVITRFLRNFACWKCEGNVDETVEQFERL